MLAVAALAATSAFAQSSVSIYGLVDVAFAKSKGSSAALIDGGVDGSRIGFKGTEDLGGGLKANFVLEQGFDVTSGAQGAAGQAFSREASLGLSGAFGAVKAGKVWTAYDDVSGAAYATFDSALSAENVFLSNAYQGNPTQGLRYETPVFSGFSGAVSYNLEQAAGNQHVVSLSAKYENGPLMVGFGYQDENGSTNSSFAATEMKFTRLNAAYDFGSFKLKGSYGRVKNDNVGGGKANEFAIGADVPVASNIVLSGGFASSKADGEGKRSTGLSLAAAYLLSKRTTVYGGYVAYNKQAESRTINGQSFGKADTFAVGVKHTF